MIERSQIKLPPYGRDLIGKPPAPNQNIVLGTGMMGWKVAKSWMAFQPVLVLPLGHDPAEYQWPVAGWYVFVIDAAKDTSFDILHKLAITLIKSGATKVLVSCSILPAPLYEPNVSEILNG